MTFFMKIKYAGKGFDSASCYVKTRPRGRLCAVLLFLVMTSY